jgi:hypothetical protein
MSSITMVRIELALSCFIGYNMLQKVTGCQMVLDRLWQIIQLPIT